ncbi:EGF-like domain protein, partial [Ostertagia ostertagi]
MQRVKTVARANLMLVAGSNVFAKLDSSVSSVRSVKIHVKRGHVTTGYCKASDSAGFECECEEGFSGKTCSVLSDLCTTSSCSGRGHCTPVWNATLCTCDKRWRGAACTHLVDECLSIPCENDGTCETTAEGFKCHCKKYYLGDRCELQGTCLTHPCERGECIQLSFDSHSCSCPKGYEGTRCEMQIARRIFDECLLGFCANGKNCTVDINECSVTSNCVNGQCTNTRGGYRCDCENGFIGSRCTVRNPCQPDSFNRTTHTCVHGVCINPVVKVYLFSSTSGHYESVMIHEY